MPFNLLFDGVQGYDVDLWNFEEVIKAEFPPVNRMSDALRERIAEKWASYPGINQPT